MNRSDILDDVLAGPSRSAARTSRSALPRPWSRVAAGAFALSFAFAGLAVAQAAPAAAACNLRPVPSSQVCTRGSTTWTYSYLSSYVEHGNYATPPKSCYRFLVTGWNPCATPTQYNQTICER